MCILVTGAAGHLGEALVRTLRVAGRKVKGLDRKPSPFVDHVGSIVQRTFVRQCLAGVEGVIHAATLHKPHVGTHARQDFIDTNITGTLHLLEEAAAAGVRAFVLTSTTSVFGRALTPAPGEPAAWITEEVVPVPKNIYGVTKAAAEDLGALVHQASGLPCIILRTSRFFPEEDDARHIREAWDDANLKANELLHRRVDLEDAVGAHLLALERAPELGFGRYVISATTPFRREDRTELVHAAPAVVARLVPRYLEAYRRRGWRMVSSIDRVYDNRRARTDLGWAPHWDFAHLVDRLAAGEVTRSELASRIGSKGYHDTTFDDGPYPVDEEGRVPARSVRERARPTCSRDRPRSVS